MTNFNERMDTLLNKNIISHTLFLKGWCWLWVRDELETETDCYIDPKFFFDHSSTSFSSGLGLLKSGLLAALSLQADSHAGILFPTDSSRLCPGYIIVYANLLPLSFRLFTQEHLLIDGSVEGQFITRRSDWIMKKKRTSRIVESSLLVAHKVKIKEN